MSKDFWRKAGIRALRTFGQSFVASVGGSAVVLSDVNWLYCLSAAALASILSIATSLVTGLPEVDEEK